MNLHLCKDLMLVAKVSSWAKSNEVAYKSVKSPDLLESLLNEHPVVLVMVDLQFPGLDVDALAGIVRKAGPEIRLVGYAQHVLTDLIAAAQQAGFEVLTRGQFDRGFVQLLNVGSAS